MARLGHRIAAEAPAVSKPAPVATATGASAAPPSSPVHVPPATVSKESEFGVTPEVLRKRRSAEPGTPQELVARVRTVSQRPHGEFRIELDNDQVWVQTQRTGYLLASTIMRETAGQIQLARTVLDFAASLSLPRAADT